MEYNSQRTPLILAEYGRHVQDMVAHIKTIADKSERTKAAETTVEVMSQLNPQYKSSDELKQKLWDDLHIIAGYELDVDSPYPMPEPKDNIRPERLKYPNQDFKYKHYGRVIEELIAIAKKMENTDERQELTRQIANLMKKSYLNYNRDSVNDEMLVEQLKAMSDGVLVLEEDFKFQHTNEILGKNRKQPRNQSQQQGSKKKRKWKQRN